MGLAGWGDETKGEAIALLRGHPFGAVAPLCPGAAREVAPSGLLHCRVRRAIFVKRPDVADGHNPGYSDC